MAQQQSTVNTTQQGLMGMPQHHLNAPTVMSVSMNNIGHQNQVGITKPDGNMPPSLVNVQSFVGNNNMTQQTTNTNQNIQQTQQQQIQIVGTTSSGIGVNVPVAPVNSMQQTFSGTPSKGNASTTAQAPNPPVGATQPSNSSDGPQQLLSKTRLMELVRDVDPTVQLDDEVEEMLLSIADSFVESIANGSCKIAKHRHMQTVEVRDVQLYLEQAYNIWIPGLGTDELRPYKRSAITEAHKQRMALIRKTKNK